MKRYWLMLTSASALVLTGTAIAQVPDTEMARCAAITDGATRLGCLDALVAGSVARLQAGTVAPAAPTAIAAVAAAPYRVYDQIEGRVEGWGPNTHFRLKNGQVWRVSDGSTGDLGLTDPKVTIRRNRFGTYFLEFEGRNDSPKVRRES